MNNHREDEFASGDQAVLPTFESERAALVAEVGECCMGSDPFCSGGCLVERALRKRQVSTPKPQRETELLDRIKKIRFWVEHDTIELFKDGLLERKDLDNLLNVIDGKNKVEELS